MIDNLTFNTLHTRNLDELALKYRKSRQVQFYSTIKIYCTSMWFWRFMYCCLVRAIQIHVKLQKL